MCAGSTPNTDGAKSGTSPSPIPEPSPRFAPPHKHRRVNAIERTTQRRFSMTMFPSGGVSQLFAHEPQNDQRYGTRSGFSDAMREVNIASLRAKPLPSAWPAVPSIQIGLGSFHWRRPELGCRLAPCDSNSALRITRWRRKEIRQPDEFPLRGGDGRDPRQICVEAGRFRAPRYHCR